MDSTVKGPVIALCGPTASGKTGLALELARHFEVEIVSVDSRQVYRQMDIGTAKPTREERRQVTHHLIDVVDPDEDFTASDFVDRARQAIADIHRRGRLPLLVGGTGLYLRALLSGLIDAPPADQALRAQLHQREEVEGHGTLYRELQRVDPAQAEIIHPHNLVRIVRALEVFQCGGRQLSALQQNHRFADQPYQVLTIGVNCERDILATRIATRTAEMLRTGLVAEVEGLLAAGYSRQLKALRTIGYREVIACLTGELPVTALEETISRETRRYAKRQMTWYRREKSIIWVDSFQEFDTILKLIENYNENTRSGYGQDTV